MIIIKKFIFFFLFISANYNVRHGEEKEIVKRGEKKKLICSLNDSQMLRGMFLIKNPMIMMMTVVIVSHKKENECKHMLIVIYIKRMRYMRL